MEQIECVYSEIIRWITLASYLVIYSPFPLKEVFQGPRNYLFDSAIVPGDSACCAGTTF